MRVADRVFAPHYAAPLPHRVVADATVTATREGDPIARLAPGQQFEVLELTAAQAWGVAPGGVVGYVARDALAAR